MFASGTEPVFVDQLSLCADEQAELDKMRRELPFLSLMTLLRTPISKSLRKARHDRIMIAEAVPFVASKN
jgi:hypothetical protein